VAIAANDDRSPAGARVVTAPERIVASRPAAARLAARGGLTSI